MEIIVRADLVQDIEALQYEAEARKDVITHMIDMGMDPTSDKFKGYHKDYMDYFIKYQQAKQKVIDEYAPGHKTGWNLDFSTCTLTLE